jgi:hypothetical protein
MSHDAASDSFDDILALARPDLRPVCSALRKLITAEDSETFELIWPKLRMASFGIGPRKLTQHYAYIAVQADHINLGFYHGTSLQDPDGLLVGSGKALRHIKIRDASFASNPAVRGLLRQAIKDRRQRR